MIRSIKHTPIALPLVVLALLVACAGEAKADFFYAFNQTDYQVAPGGTVSVQLFLVATNPPNNNGQSDATTLGPTGLGLFGNAGQINFTSAAHPVTISAIPADIIANPAFNVSGALISRNVGANFANLSENLFLAADPQVFAPAPSGTPPTTSILVGTFIFDVPLDAVDGEVTTLTSIRHPVNGNVVLGDQVTAIDALIGQQGALNQLATITVVAPVPEPTSIALVGVAGSAGLLGWFRKRRGQQTPPATV